MDCLSGLKNLPDNSVDCCVTSPPYYALRDYDHQDQIGLEDTPEEFIENLVRTMEEVRRVLKPEGTLWLNIGDSYASSGKNRTEDQATKNSTLQGTPNINVLKQKSKITGDLKSKDLIGIPWMLAFALRSAGWYLRQDIIWHKPNPMPESVKDRCTKSHEYIFLLSKSRTYYFDADAIKEKSVYGESKYAWGRAIDGSINDKRKGLGRLINKQKTRVSTEKRNKRSVWSVTTKGFKEAHFATFPEKLIVDCIKAGCPEGGIVLDPFMGAGTTALVSRKLNRNYIGFEINEDYIKIAQKRLNKELGLFL